MLLIRNTDGFITSLEVGQFEYTSALSQCYVVVLQVLEGDQPFNEEGVLLRPARLQYQDSRGGDQILSGVITALTREVDPVKKRVFYEIRIEPYLALLALERQFRVHEEKSPLEICAALIQTLSQKYALSDYADFRLSTPGLVMPLRTHDVQNEAHHLAYFEKLLNTARYYFEQTEADERLVVIDHPVLLPFSEQTLWGVNKSAVRSQSMQM